MKVLSLSLVMLILSSCASNTLHKHHRGIASNSERPKIDQVFAAVTGNFNSDPYSDVAFIVDNPSNEEFFELWIYLTTKEGHGSRQLALKNSSFIYKVKGQFVSIGEPSLSKQTFTEEGKPDTLIVSAEHMGVGRSASLYEVKFSYRDQLFLMAGIEWRSFDKLQEYGSQNCSFNLLSGKFNNGISRSNKKMPSHFIKQDASLVKGNFFEDVISLCPERK